MQGRNVPDVRDEALREFFLVLRDALLMVVRYIERRYMNRN